MLGKRIEAESLRSVQDDSHEIGNEKNHRVEIIYLPEGILADHRRSKLHVVPTDIVIDRRSKGSVHKSKKWSRRLNLAFSIFLALALVLPAVLSVYLGIGIHTVVTGSMRPTIQQGDLMISKVERVSRVKVGDVVLLLSPITGQMQAHRVISKVNSGDMTTFVTKGDANPVADAPVSVGTVTLTRRVISIVPKFGYVMKVVSSTIARTIAGLSFVIVFFVFVYSQIVRRRNDRKQSNFNSTNRK